MRDKEYGNETFEVVDSNSGLANSNGEWDTPERILPAEVAKGIEEVYVMSIAQGKNVDTRVTKETWVRPNIKVDFSGYSISIDIGVNIVQKKTTEYKMRGR